MIKHLVQCKCDRCGNIQTFDTEDEAAKAGWCNYQFGTSPIIPQNTVLCPICEEAHAMLKEAFMKGTAFGLRKAAGIQEHPHWYISN